MSETMVRASGGYSSQNVEAARDEGRLAGIAEAKQGNAQRTMVLSRDDNGNTITFTNSEMINAEGLMQNRGNVNIVLNSRSENALIPEGYHKGRGIVSVREASGSRILADDERGIVDIGALNDTRYVDATAPTQAAYAEGVNQGRSDGYRDGYNAGHTAGYNEGVRITANNVMANGGCSIAIIGSDHVDVDEHIQSAFTNDSAYPMNLTIAAVSSRPRGDGYSDPVISATNTSSLDYRTAQYSDTGVQTNVSMAVGTYKLASGKTTSFTIGVQNKAGAVTYTVTYKRAD